METSGGTSKIAALPGGGAPEEGAYRLPPVNLEAEQALLGAILANNAAYERVSDFLLPEHFGDGVHGRIYEICGRLIERNQVT